MLLRKPDFKFILNFFEIREIKQNFIQILLHYAVIVITITITVFSIRESEKLNFIDVFKNVSTYCPKSEENKGLIGKINSSLKNALLDTNPSTDLLLRYNNLIFAYDTSNIYAKYDLDVRLVGYKSGDFKNNLFFYNSQFNALIEKQKANLNQRYFHIYFNSSYTKIDSIKVAEEKLNTSLMSNNWKGTIHFKDPTINWDSSRRFLVYKHCIIPLFNVSGETSIKAIDHNLYRLNIENLLDIYENNRKISLNRLGIDEIYIKSDSLFVHSKLKISGILKNQPHSFSLKSLNKPIVVDGVKIIDSFIITTKSPFEYASQIANGAMKANRINIDTAFSDLFSQQIINEFILNSSKDTATNYFLSYDAVQSKFYEDLFKKEWINSLDPNRDFLENYEINLTLTDIQTGQIICAPFYSTHFDAYSKEDKMLTKNFNLETEFKVGSLLKPIFAFASVACDSNLLNYSYNQFNITLSNSDSSNYQISNGSNRIVNIGSLSTNSSRIKKSYQTPCNTFSEFLAKSNNGYLLGLTSEPLKLFDNKYYNSDKKLLLNYKANPLFKKTSSMFSLNIYNKGDILKDSLGLKGSLLESSFLLPQKNHLFEELSVEETHKSYPGSIKTTLLGQGECRLSLFDICQSYARILSKKMVKLTYSVSSYIFETISVDEISLSVINQFIASWQQANSMDPTYRSGFESFQNLDSNSSYRIFFKTGTPDDYSTNENSYIRKVIRRNHNDEGNFAMAITDTLVNSDKGLSGVVMAVHVRRKTKSDGEEIAGNILVAKFVTTDFLKKVILFNQNRFKK